MLAQISGPVARRALGPGGCHLALVPPSIQQQLLAQTIAGIRSALDPQQAALIGGHTLEERNTALIPAALGCS